MIAKRNRTPLAPRARARIRIRLRAMCMGLVVSVGLGLILGCTDDGFAPPVKDLSSIYWELRVNYPAVLLSTAASHNTVHLVTMPYGADGRALQLDSLHGPAQAPVWTSSDSSKVSVSSTGVVTALAEIDSVRISVRQTIGRITRADSVQVRVTGVTNPPVLTTFSVTPNDSLKRAYRYIAAHVFPVTALDVAGEPIEEVPVRWQSSNLKAVNLCGYAPGWCLWGMASPVTISATTWVYGVAKRDSFTLEIGWPIFSLVGSFYTSQMVQASGKIDFVTVQRRVDIGPGGMVPFENNTGYGVFGSGLPALPGKTIDIIFDDPTVALSSGGWPGDTSGVGGNIIGLPSDTTLFYTARQQWRRFRTPGEHFYTIQPFGVRSSIHVHDK